MSGRVRFSWSILCMVAAVALSALPAAAQSSSSKVTIAVSPVQQVEGTTSLVVAANAPIQQARLVVKSNTPWVLVAHTSGTGAVVSVKIAGSSSRQRLGAATPVLTGLKGVHQLEFEVQLDGRVAQQALPLTVTFSVEQAAAL